MISGPCAGCATRPTLRRCSASPKRLRWQSPATSSTATCMLRSSPRAIIGRSTSSPVRSAWAISTLRRPPSRSIPVTSKTGSTSACCWPPSSAIGANSRRGRRAPGSIRITPLTKPALWAVSFAWAGATGSTVCSPSSWPTADQPGGTSGPKWSVETRARSASSVTCRMPGWRRTSFAAGSTCSPGTGATIVRSCLAAACRQTG